MFAPPRRNTKPQTKSRRCEKHLHSQNANNNSSVQQGSSSLGRGASNDTLITKRHTFSKSVQESVATKSRNCSGPSFHAEENVSNVQKLGKASASIDRSAATSIASATMRKEKALPA